MPSTLAYAIQQNAPRFKQKRNTTRKYYVDWGGVRTGTPTLTFSGSGSPAGVSYDSATNRSSFDVTMQSSGFDLRVQDENGYTVDMVIFPAHEPRESRSDYGQNP